MKITRSERNRIVRHRLNQQSSRIESKSSWRIFIRRAREWVWLVLLQHTIGSIQQRCIVGASRVIPTADSTVSMPTSLSDTDWLAVFKTIEFVAVRLFLINASFSSAWYCMDDTADSNVFVISSNSLNHCMPDNFYDSQGVLTKPSLSPCRIKDHSDQRQVHNSNMTVRRF